MSDRLDKRWDTQYGKLLEYNLRKKRTPKN